MAKPLSLEQAKHHPYPHRFDGARAAERKRLRRLSRYLRQRDAERAPPKIVAGPGTGNCPGCGVAFRKHQRRRNGTLVGCGGMAP